MEERGNPAGLRQAPWEKRRRERGRAAPTRDQIACYGQPLGLIYIGEGEEGAPPLGFPPLGGAAALDGKGVAAKGRFPSPPRHLGGALPPWDPYI